MTDRKLIKELERMRRNLRTDQYEERVTISRMIRDLGGQR